MKLCSISYMPAKQKTFKTMTEAIREAIAESGLSFKRLERETGVIRQSLMKFAAGEQTLRLDAADKLAVYFGLQVVQQRKAK
jgi:ribosome-binding protein aMBF1 (putative translation factor)